MTEPKRKAKSGIDITPFIAQMVKATGESEVEIVKKIVTILALKAEVYGIPQKVQVFVRGVRDG